MAVGVAIGWGKSAVGVVEVGEHLQSGNVGVAKVHVAESLNVRLWSGGDDGPDKCFVGALVRLEGSVLFGMSLMKLCCLNGGCWLR